MKNLKAACILTATIILTSLLSLSPPAWAAKYELTRNSIEEAKEMNAADISLYPRETRRR